MYPDTPGAVDVIETHKSWVFLTRSFAYKLKKPIRYNGIDFTTLAARKANSHEEVRLNRRLARDTYLGVIELTQDVSGVMSLDGPGETIDVLLHMRRLPADLMLDTLLRSGRVREHDLRRVGRCLGAFYRECPPVPFAPGEYATRLGREVDLNLRELSLPAYELPSDLVRRVCQAQLDLLRAEPELFEARAREGRVIEGHGDLRPEHICLEDPPVIFDCLEFNRDLRIIDIADELAFLVMECERIGARSVAPPLLDEVEREVGDRPPERLLSFYGTYRACMWARLAAWRAREHPGEPRRKWLDRADAYIRLAGTYASRASKTI